MNFRKLAFAGLLVGAIAVPYATQGGSMESTQKARAERNKKIIKDKQTKKAEKKQTKAKHLKKKQY